jgi:periplasmic protein TonB
MQDVLAFPRSPLIELWRERSTTVIVVFVGALLAAGLLALIWAAIHSPEPTRREPTIIQLLLVTPAAQQRPPKPAQETVQRITQAPPPIPVPPKKPVEQRRDSFATAPTPKSKPAPPQPKTRSAAVANPLSLDAPPDWRQFALPQGANTGNVIGGDGENGGGSGCGGAGAFLPIVTSQIRTVFSRDEKMDSRTFHIQAQLWFDDLGAVRRSQLLGSTGKADLDAAIRTRLGEINVGRGMPQCVQPITVWVNQPRESAGAAGRNDMVPEGTHIEIWQSHPRARN